MRAARVFPETRERLFVAASRLMIEKGYPATSIDEICTAAGVTKGSFFHYFTSKDHLGRELLQRSLDDRVAEHERLAVEPDPLQRLYRLIDQMIRRVDEREVEGCLLGVFAQELSRTHPEIGRLCAGAFNTWIDGLTRDLEEAKARYAPHAAVAPRSLAEHLVAVVEGAFILARAHGEGRVLRESLQHFRGYLEMLFGLPAA